MPRVDRLDFMQISTGCGLVLDRGRLRDRADLQTPQGGARVPARLARTGVQTYQQSDGSTIREYRPASEVFDAKSLKSFETATVTRGHPNEVTPQSWNRDAVGFVLNPHEDSGKYVAADLVIQNAETLDAIDAGELQEISCGYTCDLIMSPGVSPDGEKYDAVQTGIVINHVAIGPRDWGRAGPEVKLKLDGGVCFLDSCEAHVFDRTAAIRELITIHKIFDTPLGDKSDAYLSRRLELARMTDEERADFFATLVRDAEPEPWTLETLAEYHRNNFEKGN